MSVRIMSLFFWVFQVFIRQFTELDLVSHGEMVVGRKSLRKLIRTDGTETNVTERAGKAVIDGEISSLEDRNHLLHLQLVLAELQQVHKLSLEGDRLGARVSDKSVP